MNSPSLHPSIPAGEALSPLAALFAPRSIALIGASERPGSVGMALFVNLMARHSQGELFAVNPLRSHVLGRAAYASVLKVPSPPDLAVIAVPAPGVPEAVRQCAEAGVKACVVISSGFRECGASGEALELEILKAKGPSMRVLGPNCMGLMAPWGGLNASFAKNMAPAGSVAFVSQSGALLSGILDWSLREGFGFSAVVSLGSMLDIGWEDVIRHLGRDKATQSILLYMESVGDSRGFLRACRVVAPLKPIIVLKSGRSASGSRAAASHTGALMTSDAVLDAALRSCGVVRVDSVEELFSAAEALDMQPQPLGPGLALVTNAGGPGVLAADALEKNGGELAPLSPQSLRQLDALLPPHWSHANPIDILGDATPDRYAKALEIAAADPANHGILAILTPQFMTDPDGVARQLCGLAKKYSKPLYASFMGAAEVSRGVERLKKAGIPCFPYPDEAARLFCQLWQYRQGLHMALPPSASSPPGARQPVIYSAMSEGHSILSEHETKLLLQAYGLPVHPSTVALSADEAAAAADVLGYPVVLKLHSHSATHKSELGGVRLDLRDAPSVRGAFESIWVSVQEKAGPGYFEGVNVQRQERRRGTELILGSSCDPQFGPVLMLGLGGTRVELFRDAALALPPLGPEQARSLIVRSPAAKLLRGWRGEKALDEAELVACLCAFSRLVMENPRLKEIEINPLVAGRDGLLALDARAILHPAALKDAELPRAALVE